MSAIKETLGLHNSILLSAKVSTNIAISVNNVDVQI